MDTKEASDSSRSALDAPPEAAHGKAREENVIAEKQERIFEELMDDAGPDTPPTEEEMLALIMGEIAFMRVQRNRQRRAICPTPFGFPTPSYRP